MFQIGMENAVRTCPYHEKRERNLQASCSNVDLLLEFSKWTQVLSLLLLFLIDMVEEIYHLQR